MRTCLHQLVNVVSHRNTHNLHGIAVQAGAHEHVVVVVVAKDLLHGSGGASLKLLDFLLAGALLLELVVDGSDVAYMKC